MTDPICRECNREPCVCAMTDKAVSDAAWESEHGPTERREHTEEWFAKRGLVLRTRAEWEELKQRAERAEALCDRLKLEAQSHAQEARTANATIAEIYQLCTGATGEPGNWNGAEPVRALAARLAAAEMEIADRDARWTSDLAKASREINRATEADHARLRREISDLTARLAAAEADAERYRLLRRKVGIAGGLFHILNLAPTYVAPNAAIELDAAIDAAIAQETKS